MHNKLDSASYYPELHRSSLHTASVPPERLGLDTATIGSVIQDDGNRTLHSSYGEAMRSDYEQQWPLAIKEEIKSLNDEKVWKLVPLPDDRKEVPVGRTYNVKLST